MDRVTDYREALYGVPLEGALVSVAGKRYRVSRVYRQRSSGSIEAVWIKDGDMERYFSLRRDGQYREFPGRADAVPLKVVHR